MTIRTLAARSLLAGFLIPTVSAKMPVMAAYWSALEKPSVLIAKTYPPGVLPGVINKLILTHVAFDDFAKLEATDSWKANLAEYRALKAKGVSIWVMIANGQQARLDPKAAPGYIRELVDFCARSGFDGVDVDFEGPSTVGHKNYNNFCRTLADALHAKGMKISIAAHATWTFKFVEDATVAKLDFILPMAYDATGPWKPDKPGPHSDFNYAKACVDAMFKRKVPASKILLGMPTYGYRFYTEGGVKKAADFGWAGLLKKYPEARDKDVAGPGAGTAEGAWYYNGLATVRKKTEWADKLGLVGFGVWHGNHESKDPASSFWLTVKAANK